MPDHVYSCIEILRLFISTVFFFLSFFLLLLCLFFQSPKLLMQDIFWFILNPITSVFRMEVKNYHSFTTDRFDSQSNGEAGV